MHIKHHFYRLAIRSMSLMRLHKILNSSYSGLGSILAFHRVAARRSGFSPNEFLAITPEFFDELIRYLRREGFAIVTMDDLADHIAGKASPRKMVTLSFDDGYLDNYENAWRLCRQHGVPMTLNVTTGFLDRTAYPWWDAMEELLRQRDQLVMPGDGGTRQVDVSTLHAKAQTFRFLSDQFRGAGAEARIERLMELERLNGIDLRGYCDQLMMSWDMLGDMVRSGLVEIGAHTLTHPALSCLSEEEVAREMAGSRAILAERVGRPVKHFAYPFGGSREAGPREFEIARRVGFTTAVTTRHGTLHPEHHSHLTALPRVSVNGEHQTISAIELFLSGASMAFTNHFRRVVTA
ncbi:polysaccharide deacetylase family protein [Azospirillum sp. sgz302134]